MKYTMEQLKELQYHAEIMNGCSPSLYRKLLESHIEWTKDAEDIPKAWPY